MNDDEGLVHVRIGAVTLDGNLLVPPGAAGIVLFAHGSGSSRFSSRNRFVASTLRDGNLGTLLLDLLTPDEEARDNVTAELRFDIGMLADRLAGTAALVAAAARPDLIQSVVSRGGRPDLAGAAVPRVEAPTLLIVGGDDTAVIEMKRPPYGPLRCAR